MAHDPWADPANPTPIILFFFSFVLLLCNSHLGRRQRPGLASTWLGADKAQSEPRLGFIDIFLL